MIDLNKLYLEELIDIRDNIRSFIDTRTKEVEETRLNGTIVTIMLSNIGNGIHLYKFSEELVYFIFFKLTGVNYVVPISFYNNNRYLEPIPYNMGNDTFDLEHFHENTRRCRDITFVKTISMTDYRNAMRKLVDKP